MLQAFIDESESKDPPLFTMAGYIASAEEWAAFSDEWQQYLDMSPGIKYFMMQEAMSLEGEFRHWSESLRDEKVRLLEGVIFNHARVALQLTFNPKDLEEVFGDVPNLKRPYYYAFHTIITALAHYQKREGIIEKVDFIFDNQVMEKDKIMKAWDNVGKDNGYLSDVMGETPAFRDDEYVLPLQAADHMAWIGRETFKRHVAGLPPYEMAPFPSHIKKRKMELIGFLVDKETLKMERQGVERFARRALRRERMAKTAHIISYPARKPDEE